MSSRVLPSGSCPRTEGSHALCAKASAAGTLDKLLAIVCAVYQNPTSQSTHAGTSFYKPCSSMMGQEHAWAAACLPTCIMATKVCSTAACCWPLSWPPLKAAAQASCCMRPRAALRAMQALTSSLLHTHKAVSGLGAPLCLTDPRRACSNKYKM